MQSTNERTNKQTNSQRTNERTNGEHRTNEQTNERTVASFFIRCGCVVASLLSCGGELVADVVAARTTHSKRYSIAPHKHPTNHTEVEWCASACGPAKAWVCNNCHPRLAVVRGIVSIASVDPSVQWSVLKKSVCLQTNRSPRHARLHPHAGWDEERHDLLFKRTTTSDLRGQCDGTLRVK